MGYLETDIDSSLHCFLKSSSFYGIRGVILGTLNRDHHSGWIMIFHDISSTWNAGRLDRIVWKTMNFRTTTLWGRDDSIYSLKPIPNPPPKGRENRLSFHRRSVVPPGEDEDRNSQQLFSHEFFQGPLRGVVWPGNYPKPPIHSNSQQGELAIKLLDVQRSLLIYSPKIDTWQLLVHYILHLFPSQLKHITHGSQMRVPQSRIQNKCFPQVNQVSSIKFCYDCSCKHVRHRNLWDSIMVPLCSIIFWARDLIPQPPSLMRKPWELCVWLKLRRGDLECHLTGWLRYRVGLGTPRKKT